MSIRILLADDHAIVRDGLRALLEKQPDMTVAGEASDGREAVQIAEENAPDVVVMDIAMPTMNGIEATRRIIATRPSTAVVILSMHQDESYVLRSLKAGARGYLLKDSLRSDDQNREVSAPRAGLDTTPRRLAWTSATLIPGRSSRGAQIRRQVGSVHDL